MYFNILKKDLKRKKTMNVILLLFVMIATMFVSSSVCNIFAVVNGTDYFFEQAGLLDYIILHQGGGSASDELNDVLENSDVDKYMVEEMLFLPPKTLYKDGQQHEEMKFYFFLMPAENSKLNLFDGDNRKITSVAPGEAYLSAPCMKMCGLEIGDEIEVRLNGHSTKLRLTENCKDAIFGAKMFSTPRFILNDDDYAAILENADISGSECRAVYVGSDDLKSIQNAVSHINGILFADRTGVLKNMYLIDLVIAAVLLVVSICLILVAVVVLKFTISFTLSEEFREIGVMKAIGIKSSKIRGLYITKYIGIAVIGSVIGFFLSIPFGKMMLSSVSEQMVLGSDNSLAIYLLSSLAVVLTVFLFSWLCTAGVKKATPLDAIRSGQTGERFNKKRGLRLGKSRSRVSGFMAVNDVISSPKSYVTLMIAFTICLSIVLTIAITDTTLAGDSLLPTFGVVECDAFIPANIIDIEDIRGQDGEDKLNSRFSEIEKELADNGIPAIVHAEMQINVSIEHNGNTSSFRAQKNSGHTSAADYVYTEGSAPVNSNEIAVTPLIAEELEAHIGDTVTIINTDGSADEYLITGYFESMNNLGKLIRLPDDFPCDFVQLSALFDIQVEYTDSPDKQVRKERFEKLQDMYGKDEVHTISGFVEECIGVGSMISSLKFLVLAVTMVVTALVTVLMERSFIAKEKSEIALMKAIGFRSSAVMRIHTLRFGIVSVVSSAAACILSLPATKLCITPIFRTMGLSSMNYQIDPLQLFVIYPLCVIAITVVTAFLTSLYTGTIKASDASNIE